MKDKKTLIILGSILLLGIFLRFHQIGSESFWQDEAHTAFAMKKYTALDIIKNTMKEGQVIIDSKYTYNSELPVYYVFLKGWTKVFGISEVSLRSFSAFFGSIALIAIFYLAKLLFHKKIALLTAFLAAINLTLIWYSQEARPASYLLFLCTLSIILFLKCIKEGKKGHFIGLLVVNLLIMYSYMPLVLLVSFEGFFTLYISKIWNVKREKTKIKVLTVFIILALLYIPIMGRILFSKVDTLHIDGRPDIIKLAKFLVELDTWVYPEDSTRQKLHNSNFDLTLFEFILFFSAGALTLLCSLEFIFGLFKSLMNKESAIFASSLFFYSIGSAIIISWLHKSITIFHMRILIFIIPVYLLMISIGIVNSKFSGLILILLIATSIPPIYAYYKNIDKQQFREVADYLPENELILISKDTAKRGVWYYYGDTPNVVGVDDVNELKLHLNNKDSFWVLLTFTKYSDPEDKIKAYLDGRYQIKDKKEFFDIELLHYKK